jgi:hypothetical protein
VADWSLQPFESLGPLRLGAARSDVAKALGEAPREFAKGDGSNVVEAYDKAGVHAYYDREGRLEFLEAFDSCKPVYAGIQLLGPDAASVVARLHDLGLMAREDGEGGVWFDDHGFALYAPSEASEGVSVFPRGYDSGV